MPKLFPKFLLLLMATSLLVGCHDKFQVHEIEIPATENSNLELFGQDLEPYVDSEMVVRSDFRGFLAKPKAEGTYPGVVMIHEWWGLNDNIKEMAKILANEGYTVLAIDLYDGEVATDSARAQELSGMVRDNPEEAIQKMKAATEYLKTEQKAYHLGSLGWCFGGGESLQLALNDNLDATVIYYGTLVNDEKQLNNIDWPILGIFGEEDTSIPQESVEAFQQALNDLAIENQIYTYPGVGHAFANPSGINYAPEATLDAWAKTLEFLNDNLK